MIVALNSPPGVRPPLQPPVNDVNCCGRLCGRMFADWSQGVMWVLSLGGFAAEIAGNVLHEKWVIAAGIAALGSAALLGIFRITCLKPLRETEQQLEFYQGENVRLHGLIEGLNDRLGQLAVRRDELRETLVQAKKSIEDLNAVLDSKVKDLGSIAAKLQATEINLARLDEIYTKYKKDTLRIAEGVKDFQEAAKGLQAGSALLGDEVDALGVHTGGIAGEGDRVERANQEFTKKNEELLAILEKMTKHSDRVGESIQGVKSSITALKDSTSEIGAVEGKLLHAAEMIKQAVHEFGDQKNELKELFREETDGEGGGAPAPPAPDPDV